MKNTKTPKTYRQGDVLIVEIQSLPGNLTPLKDKERVILAHGEVTGHAHALDVQEATGYAETNEALGLNEADFIEVHAMLGELKHEEHSTIRLPKGKYRIVHQREYSPEEIRRVAD